LRAKELVMKATMISLFIFFQIIFFCLPAQATIIVPSTLEYMTETSHTIITGRVIGMQSYEDDEQGMIFTNVEVEVDEVIKNGDVQPGDILDIKTLGGTVGDRTIEIDMAPVFNIGDRVFLFLIYQEGSFFVHTIYYGNYTITTVEQDGQTSEIVSGPLFDVPVHYDQKHTALDNKLDSGLKDLNTFRNRVKSLVGSQ